MSTVRRSPQSLETKLPGKGQQQPLIVTGLTSGTTYYFRAEA